MPPILVQLDDATYHALSRMVTARRKRTEFIRAVVKEAIRRRVSADMKKAYRNQPDLVSDSDSWFNCEKFGP
jgi:hypothetical protein